LTERVKQLSMKTKWNMKNYLLFLFLLVIGTALPVLIHGLALRYAGKMFTPLHFPIFIGAMTLGGKSAVLLGVLIPLISYFLTGRPPLFPFGAAMMFEFAIFGLISSYLYKKRGINIYLALIAAMILGRIGLLTARYVYSLSFGGHFSFTGMMTSLFLTGLPGTITQLALIPIIVKMLEWLLKTDF